MHRDGNLFMVCSANRFPTGILVDKGIEHRIESGDMFQLADVNFYAMVCTYEELPPESTDKIINMR